MNPIETMTNRYMELARNPDNRPLKEWIAEVSPELRAMILDQIKTWGCLDQTPIRLLTITRD